MLTQGETCAVCGGPFSVKRIIIDGFAMHERCSFMSYPPHTAETMAKMHDALQAEIERLRAALKEIAAIYRVDDGVQIVRTKEAEIARAAIGRTEKQDADAD